MKGRPSLFTLEHFHMEMDAHSCPQDRSIGGYPAWPRLLPFFLGRIVCKDWTWQWICHTWVLFYVSWGYFLNKICASHLFSGNILWQGYCSSSEDAQLSLQTRLWLPPCLMPTWKRQAGAFTENWGRQASPAGCVRRQRMDSHISWKPPPPISMHYFRKMATLELGGSPWRSWPALSMFASESNKA